MPRKRKPRPKYIIRPIDPEDPNAIDDHDLVRGALVDFKKELAGLPDEVHEQFVADLVEAVRIARSGIEGGIRHKSNKAFGRHVFMADVSRSMKRARLPVKRWQHHDEGGDESLYYRIAHALADVSRVNLSDDLKSLAINLPRNLKPLARWAALSKYGEMSPRMKAAQNAELAAQRQQRLRDVWGDHLVYPPRICEELASAYLGFPF